jgi:serine/threonine protein kinase/Tfp pilus assembly protein PilF
MITCTTCGVENIETARFCKACGAVLHSSEITLVLNENLPGRSIIKDRFKIIKILGKGGMGEVLLAEDVKLKRKVAIKSILLKDNLAISDTTSKLRFLREAQTASQLDHSNICTLYEIYEESDRDYIMMQYIDGVSLDQIIGVQKLSIDKILDIGIQVCEGMIEAHSHDIIHRDIKPGNLMIDKKGVVRILDFGLAKFSGESFVKDDDRVDSNLTEKGFVMGTVAYISPEQARGKSLDKRTDIFSFGIVLYEMIEGKNPFKRDEQIETLYNVLNKEIEFTREIPEELKRIVRKTLEKDKENRYPDFSRVKKDLETFQGIYKEGKAKKTPQVGAETEILQYEEQVKLLEEVQKTSDKEDLGDMVYRIKKFKAATERVPATTRGRRLKLRWIIPALLVVLAAAAAAYFLLKKDTVSPPVPTEKFYIYLHPFEIDTREKNIPEMLDYLLTESLNQFPEFKTINKDKALYIAGKENQDVDLELLKSKFNVKYELTGSMSKVDKGYTIDSFLKSLEKDAKPQRISAPGFRREGLLETQVDMIVYGVYNRLFSKEAGKLEIKKVKGIFGNDWERFTNFYNGVLFFKKLENTKAESFLLESGDLPIATYYLSHINYFTGKRQKALELINRIIPNIDKLTPAMQLQVRAMEARLNFKFLDEVRYLEQLKNEFPFDKDAVFELGEAYFHHANPEKAMEYYKRALELDENYSKALNHLGYCYAYTGDHRNAYKALEDYRNLDQTANSFDSLGDGYFYEGKLDYAKDMKQNAVKQSDEIISYPYQTLADIYILKAEYKKADKALEDYKRVEKGTPQANAYVLAKQAFIAYLNRQYEDALKLIDRSLAAYDSDDINEDTSDVHWLKGIILLKQDKVKESKTELQWLEKFKTRYHLDWDNFKAAYKYFIHLDALILEKENQWQKAENRFKTLIDMKNKLSYWITYYHYQFFHTEYAEFLARNRRYNEALTELARCLEFNNDYIPALWVKAEILEKQNKPAEARPIYEKINELYGESREQNYLKDLLKTKLK